jgi:hypothetical protein
LHHEPRPIDPADFKSRKPWDKPVGTPYKRPFEREKDLEKEFKTYQEGKLEQQERIRLFYILE